MTALLGKLLLFCGCTALGVGRGLALRRRTACLRAAARALEALARELSFSLRPLTELMAEAEGQSDGPVRDLFAACRRRFAEDGGESWARSWTEAVRTCPLPVRDEDRALLAEAGTVLVAPVCRSRRVRPSRRWRPWTCAWVRSGTGCAPVRPRRPRGSRP